MSSSTVDDGQYVQVRGDLFEAIQRDGVFEDSKTFVDSVPRRDPDAILRQYRDRRGDPAFDLRQFIEYHFALPDDWTADPDLPADRTMREHLRLLWDYLTRRPNDDVDERSTLLSLPYPYVAPGGRFREIYYWDSYFTAVGLAAVDEYDAVAGMANNFAALVDRHGFVPNGSRVYYLSRSQPPVFYRLVELLADGVDAAVSRYLPRLDAEYDFWMDGAADAADPAHRRVVRLPDGSVLNRYWDDDPRPRPEAFDEDRALAAGLPADERRALYRDVRAACESGWDFSSRWLRDGATLSTIRTTELLPVDLNALLYGMESTLATWHRNHGDGAAADRYEAAAAARREAVLDRCWDDDRGFFFDYSWVDGERTDCWSLAGVVPLFTGLATDEQAAAVARALHERFLRPGGLPVTLTGTGQQWDYPTGWAPTHWLAVEGLRRYGHDDLARTVARRWVGLNRTVFERTGLMMEKYDVADAGVADDRGEYPPQDGFGWTNGVALALLESLEGTLPDDVL